MNLWITAENLELKMDVAQDICEYELFAYIDVQIKCDGFYISEQMKVYADDIIPFFSEFTDMYTSLKGSAHIEEPYGNQMYIEFVCDRTGHIAIEGSLHKNSGKNTFITYFTGKVDQSAVNIA